MNKKYILQPCYIRINSKFFPTDRLKAVPLLRFVFLCASVVSYVAFILSIFVPQFGSFSVREGCVL